MGFGLPLEITLSLLVFRFYGKVKYFLLYCGNFLFFGKSQSAVTDLALFLQPHNLATIYLHVTDAALAEIDDE